MSSTKAPEFVRFDCGCVGFPKGRDGWALVIKPCDVEHSDDEFQLVMRDMSEKDEVEVESMSAPTGHSCNVGRLGLLTRLSALVHDGNRWQDLKRNLRT